VTNGGILYRKRDLNLFKMAIKKAVTTLTILTILAVAGYFYIPLSDQVKFNRLFKA